MANKFYNFTYDPSQDGYSTSIWHTVYGSAYVSGGHLRVNKGLIIHYGDIIRGDFAFSINLATPNIDDNFQIGLLQYNKNAYLYYKLDQGVLTAETSNGSTTSTTTISWDTAWSSVDTEFRIKWEAGLAQFYIGGQLKAMINDASVTGDPLSLSIYNDSVNTLLVNYIEAKGIQSFVMSQGNSDSTFEKFVEQSERIQITDTPTMVMKNYIVNNGVLSENLSITDAPSIFYPKYIVGNGVFPQAINISDVPTVSTPA